MRRYQASLLLLWALCSGCAKKPESSVRVAIGGQAQLIYLPATLAQELGYYKDEGLEVTLQDFPGGQKSLEALLGGSTDVVCGFYDHTIEMAPKGRELVAFVSVQRYPGLAAVASPQISRIEDLKGKVVGVSSAGSSTQMFLNYLLVTHGVPVDSVSVASIGMSSTAVAAVTHMKVDAAIMTDPSIEIVMKQPAGLKILADTRTGDGVRAVFGVDMYPSAVLYSTSSWLAAHPEDARRLTHAMTRTLDWLRSRSPEEIRQRIPPQFRTEDAATDLESLKNLQAMLSTDGKMSAESAALVRKVLSTSLPAVANVALEKTFTNDFVR